MHIPFYKRLLSFLFPVTLQRTIGSQLTVLELQLYRNHYILVTPRAMYSYHLQYDPFRNTFRTIQSELANVNSFLLLGTGLGSALQILQQQYHCYPQTTCVDNDETVIEFCRNYMQLNTRNNVEWIYDDVRHFLDTQTKTYDLIGIDIFKELVMPAFIARNTFIMQCRSALNPNGICIFNMIFEDDNEILQTERRLQEHFHRVVTIPDKMNTYFIAFA